MARLDEQLAALATMSPAQLRDEWQRLWGSPAPNVTADLLRGGLAYRLQEKRHGGLPAAVVRELARMLGNGDAGTARLQPAPLRPGTRLVRQWQGRTISVLAVERGFMWEERPYRSLTQIAREVTGARWSGPRFFGLTGNA